MYEAICKYIQIKDIYIYIYVYIENLTPTKQQLTFLSSLSTEELIIDTIGETRNTLHLSNFN